MNTHSPAGLSGMDILEILDNARRWATGAEIRGIEAMHANLEPLKPGRQLGHPAAA